MTSRLRQFLHDEWFQLVILGLPFIAALAAMPYATEPAPMHWNALGQVGWYMREPWSLLAIPLGMLLVYGIFYWQEARDRGRAHAQDGALTSHGKATRMIRLVMSVMVVSLCFVQIASALGRHPDLGRMASAACPLALALAGNFFGKLKPNRYMGVRVPWTLRSEAVWRKTHRAAGWLYTIGGLVAGGLCLIAPERYLLEILAIWLATIILAPLAVAWQAARRERSQENIQPTGVSLGWTAILEAAVISTVILLYFH